MQPVENQVRGDLWALTGNEVEGETGRAWMEVWEAVREPLRGPIDRVKLFASGDPRLRSLYRATG